MKRFKVLFALALLCLGLASCHQATEPQEIIEDYSFVGFVVEDWTIQPIIHLDSAMYADMSDTICVRAQNGDSIEIYRWHSTLYTDTNYVQLGANYDRSYFMRKSDFSILLAGNAAAYWEMKEKEFIHDRDYTPRPDLERRRIVADSVIAVYGEKQCICSDDEAWEIYGKALTSVPDLPPLKKIPAKFITRWGALEKKFKKLRIKVEW